MHRTLNQKRMKIVHVIEPFASGVAVFVKLLTENLSRDFHIVIHGERQQIAAAAEVKKSFTSHNVQFIPWKSAQRSISLKKDWAAFVELYHVLKMLKRRKLVDAVHLHSSKSGFLGRVACRLAHIKNVIYTPNGAPFLQGGAGVKRFLYKIFERIGNAFGGQVVCCSHSEQHEYESLGIKAVTINNGVPVTRTDLEKDENISSNRFRIVSCARITEQKNPAMFNAIAQALEANPHFEFIWVGDGEERHLLTARNIRITGWLPENEAHEIVSSADLYLSTSNFEGLSFSVLEALVFQKPVLVKNCVGNRDVVKNGLNGDLFELADEAVVKILHYFNNRKMLSVMGKYSRDFCNKEFNINATCNQYHDLYGRAVNQ
jgi:glycosyltransferase involved in cell wall biosynthesis